MAQQRTLRVNEPVFTEFNRIKIRIAQSDKENRIPSVSSVVSALIELGNRHYDELLSLAKNEGDSE